MTNCQSCGAEILGHDRFCKNCGAPAAASVEDLADTRRFDPSAPTAKTGSLETNAPLYVPAPSTYPLAPESSSLDRTQSFIKRLIQHKLVWLLAAFLLFLFIGTGVTVGREAVHHRRLRRAEQAREAERIRQTRQARQAEVQLRAREESIQNAMGFFPANVSAVEYPDVQGVFVESLTSESSPAAVARIQAGDVLMEVGDQPVRSLADLSDVLSTLKPGAEAGVKLYRDDASVTSRIRIANSTIPPFQPTIDPREQGFLGVGDVGRRLCVAGAKRWGLEIHRIIDNSPADLSGLQLGDVITEFDKQTIRTPGELARRIHAVKPRSKVKVIFYRGNTEQTVELTMGHGW